jgi:hypothetical protein
MRLPAAAPLFALPGLAPAKGVIEAHATDTVFTKTSPQMHEATLSENHK